MNLPELAAHVALIADDAERHSGPEANPALRDSHAHDAVLDLWLSHTGITVAAARRMLRLVHDELRRRWSCRQDEHSRRRLSVEALLIDLERPAGHCPNDRLTRHLPSAPNPIRQPLPRQTERSERSGALAAR